MGETLVVSIPVVVDFFLVGREDPYVASAGVPYWIDVEEYEPGSFSVDDFMEHVCEFVDNMFESRSVNRTMLLSPTGETYVLILSEVQAFTIHPVSAEEAERMIEEAYSAE